MRLAQSGDREARECFFDRYGPRLRQIVSLRMGRRLRDFVEVEDVVQEALLDCLRRIDEVELRSEGAFRNWMATIAVNAVRTEGRRSTAAKRDVRRRLSDGQRDGQGPLSESVFGADGSTPSQLASARELEERLEEALLKLEPRQRRVFELRRLCDMSYDEIAAELSIAPSAARAYLARGLARLGSALEADPGRGADGG